MNDKFIKEYKQNIMTGLIGGLATGIIFYIGENFQSYFEDKVGEGYAFGIGLVIIFALTLFFIRYVAKMKIK